MRVNIEMVPKMHDLFYENPDMRYYVIAGGRGKGATWSIARYLVARAMTEKTFIMCAREVQQSIRYSSKKTIEDTIVSLGLRKFFKFTNLETVCKKTGSKFIYSGISDMVADSIKGLESVDIVWVAESQSVSSKSLKILLPTVRKKGSHIIFDINPESEDDPVYERFITHADKVKRLALLQCSYRDNPWFTSELEETRLDDYNTLSSDDYNWIWEGHTRKYSDAQIFAHYYHAEDYDAYVPMSKRDYFYGLDFGYAKDPTALIRMFFYEGYLFIDGEARQIECGLDNTPDLMDSIMFNRRSWCKADSSRPESIDFLNKRGFRIVPALKGNNSVGDGILRLKRYRDIVIHPTRCPETLEEFDKYKWKVNKQTDEIMKVPEDKFNHSIDAIRYGTEGKELRNGVVVSGTKSRGRR